MAAMVNHEHLSEAEATADYWGSWSAALTKMRTRSAGGSVVVKFPSPVECLLDRPELRQMRARQRERAMGAVELMMLGDRADIARIAATTGGTATPAGKELRAGLIDLMLSEARDPEGEIDDGILLAELRRLEAAGGHRLLNANDRLILTKARDYLHGAAALAPVVDLVGLGRLIVTITGRRLLSEQAKAGAPHVTMAYMLEAVSALLRELLMSAVIDPG